MGIPSWIGLRSIKNAVAMDEATRALSTEDVYGADFNRGMFDISADNALRLIPVYAAVGLIADSLASLPLWIYKLVSGTRTVTPGPAWLETPDRRISLFDWIHQMMASLLLRGNAYGLILRVGGKVDQVIWIHPSQVFVDETGPLPVYYLTGMPKPYWPASMGGDILHIRAFSLPGSVVGLSPIALFKKQFETARGAVEYGHEWFENGAVPSGILKNDKATLDAEKTKEAKAQFMASVKRGEPVALDQNWSWEQVSLSPEEAQFLTTIKASATQIAVIFRVDPVDVGGESGESMHYSTVEGNQRKFNIRTLMSWATRVEQGFKPLLDPGDVAKFDLDELARPNLLERSKANTENLRNGTLRLAEARAKEDRPPLTEKEIEEWQQWYATTKSESESDATSTSTSIQPQGD